MTYYALKIAHARKLRPGEWPEAKAQTWMAIHYAADLWYPITRSWRTKWEKGKQLRYEHVARTAAGTALVYFDTEPDWPYIVWNPIARTGCEQIIGWYGRGVKPLRVPDAEVYRMRQMPEQAAAILREVEERRTIRAGCQAMVKEGAFAGEAFTVLRVVGRSAYVELPILGGRETPIDVAKMERVG